jgi:N-methylhydantoinase A
MTVRRGLDPAGYDLIAFGGAGPLHACRQATALGFRSVIVPPDAGVLSAFGLLSSAPRVDHRAAFRRRLDRLDPEEVDAALERLEREAVSRLPPEVRDGDLRRERGADVRYVGQSWELRVPIGPGPFDDAAGRRLRADFDALHTRTYGYAAPGAPVETVHLAVSVSAPRPGGSLDRPAPATGPGPGAASVMAEPAGRRRAHVGDERGMTDVPVFHLADLREGERLAGPALIDGDDSTTFVAGGFSCRVGPYRVLHLVAG